MIKKKIVFCKIIMDYRNCTAIGQSANAAIKFYFPKDLKHKTEK